MPELINHLPFPNFRYYSSDNKGKEFGVIIVKGTFEIAPDGQLVVAEEQAPMIFTDKCHGEVNVSSLWHPSDLVPKKPRADIIVNAIARAPGAEPLRSWECGITVTGPEGVLVEKRLTVTGPRWWVPKWRRKLSDDEKRDWRKHRKLFVGWELSEPEPTLEVPLRYEYAYGGTIETGADDEGNPRWDCDGRNPIGRGLIDREWTDHTQPQPAPQIEAVGEPITDPYTRYAPQSLGPIPPAWDPRLPKGGTYDQHWMDHVWPNWAADYDFAYHNSAHPELICPDLLKGGEAIVLENLILGESRNRLILPKQALLVRLVREDGSVDDREMILDTVFLDIAGKSRSDAHAFLSWRVRFEPDVFTKALLVTKADHDLAMESAAGDKVKAA